MKKLLIFILVFNSFYLFSQDRLPCVVTYTYNVNSSNQLTDFTNKTNGQNIATWHWDFGDGSFSNVPNPRHIYLNAGTYVACLSVTTVEGCENTFCDTIIIGLTPTDTNSYYAISGMVHAGYNALPSGIALLVKLVNSHYNVQQYTTITNGHYEFSQLVPGDYMVYAIPNFNIDMNYFPAYLPSYFGNSIKWENASLIHLTSYSQNCNIQLINNNTMLYGPDTISGSIHISDYNSFEYNIYYSNWFGNIEEVDLGRAANMPVVLLDNNNVPLRFAITDEEGNFSFTNLPVRIYKLTPEKPGFNSTTVTMNMQTTSTNSANCIFYLGTNNFYIEVENNEFVNSVNIYPNPVVNHAVICLNSENPQEIYISVEDIRGREVFIKEKFLSEGNEQYLIPFKTLNPGLYFIKIQAEHTPVLVYKIIKQ